MRRNRDDQTAAGQRAGVTSSSTARRRLHSRLVSDAHAEVSGIGCPADIEQSRSLSKADMLLISLIIASTGRLAWVMSLAVARGEACFNTQPMGQKSKAGFKRPQGSGLTYIEYLTHSAPPYKGHRNQTLRTT